MKRITFTTLLFVIVLTAFAQTKAKTKTVTPLKKPATYNPATNSLKNFSDSASYALGVNISQSIKRDLKTLNPDVFISAMKTVFAGQAPRFNEEEIRSILTRFSEAEESDHSKAVIEEGQNFLAKNKMRPEIKTTASGLQYEVLKEGNGIRPTATDTVICNYKGMLIDSTEFDNSYSRGEPLTIPVGSVIKGWTEGLQLMTPGSKYRFYIPYNLGYGLRGAPPTIPGGAALIFDIELLEIKKK